jgi:CheY-like chemotaxis protein
LDAANPTSANNNNVARTATILLADDDPNDARLVGIALQRSIAGLPVAVVNDGTELVSYLKGEGRYADRQAFPFPDLVLLDLKMPKMDGFEVLRWLRQQPILKRLRVIVLTNSARDCDVELAYEVGANSYLVKPTRFEDLVKTMQIVGDFWLNDPLMPDAMPRQG